jgi:hypothetical protein
VRKADKLTAIGVPIMQKIWEPRRLKRHGPPWPLTWIALLFLLFYEIRVKYKMKYQY